MLIVNYLIIILIILITFFIIFNNKKYEFYKNKASDFFLINNKEYKITIQNKKLKTNLIDYLIKNKKYLSKYEIQNIFKKENIYISIDLINIKKLIELNIKNYIEFIPNEKKNIYDNDKTNEKEKEKEKEIDTNIEIMPVYSNRQNFKEDTYYIRQGHGYYLYYLSSKKINKNYNDMLKLKNKTFKNMTKLKYTTALKKEILGLLYRAPDILIISNNSLYLPPPSGESNMGDFMFYVIDRIPLTKNYLSISKRCTDINKNVNSSNCKQIMSNLYNNDTHSLYSPINDNYYIINDDSKLNGCYLSEIKPQKPNKYYSYDIYYNKTTSNKSKNKITEITVCSNNKQEKDQKLIKKAINMYDELNKKKVVNYIDKNNNKK